jgi:hypothetical protein
MNSSPRAVYELLVDTERIREYNELFDQYEVLQNVGATAKIGWAGYKPVWPTSAREFVAITAWNDGGKYKEVGDGDGGVEGPCYVIASKSLTASESEVVGPPRKGFIRGTIECAGFVTRWCPAFLEANGGVVPEEIATEVQVPCGKGKTRQDIVYSLNGVRKGVQPRTIFTSVCQSTPGGNVPLSLVNSLAATAPYKVVKSIQKVVEARA